MDTIDDIVSASKSQILHKIVSKPRGSEASVEMTARTLQNGNMAIQRIEAACPAMRVVLLAVVSYTGMYDLGVERARGVCEACGLTSENLRRVRFVACGERPHEPAQDFLVRSDVLQMLRWIHVYLHFTEWMTLTIAEATFDEHATRQAFDFLEARVTSLTI